MISAHRRYSDGHQLGIDAGGDGFVAFVFGCLLAAEDEVGGTERLVGRAEAIVGGDRSQEADEELFALLAALEAAGKRA